jgi:putative endonuclease
MPSVYVLRSLSHGKTYVGSTAREPQERLREHNAGIDPYTNRYKPLEIIYAESFASLELAQKREAFFKSGKGRQVLKSLLESTCFRATESLARPHELGKKG